MQILDHKNDHVWLHATMYQEVEKAFWLCHVALAGIEPRPPVQLSLASALSCKAPLPAGFIIPKLYSAANRTISLFNQADEKIGAGKWVSFPRNSNRFIPSQLFFIHSFIQDVSDDIKTTATVRKVTFGFWGIRMLCCLFSYPLV